MLRLASRLLGVAIASGLVLASSSARAYCRTTTVLQAADYDASSEGCWDQGANHGIPLFWRNACVGYSIEGLASKKISYDTAANLLSRAFTRWTGATCPTEGSGKSRVSIDVRDLGPSDCTNIKYVSGAPNQNVIVFKDNAWTHPISVLGLTTVVYSPSTGEIYGADMEINTQHMDPLALADPVAGDAYDFLSVVTHEAGHFLGMAHSDHREATMYASYNVSETYQRVLSPDDIQGICTIYRPDGDRAVFNGKVTAAPQCDPTPRGGYTTQCLEPSKCSSTAVGTRVRTSGAPAVFLALVLVGGGLRRRARSSSR